ncbi:thioesterase II family protein [Desulfosporosinus youngiae]|uniref:Putative thioesterase involved in non-ribosomal peptide biosynthesis n=1 Tax=Desulfosporosinus youngiae DSM 17734 TaxID=768710 RepID=H5XU13_9FIRM|nr:thioesterase domain-containing protein [Desulfosporosinus youngiae]EHQ88971.1 putative thioesterase involved in non-ribosomal peptide biosynthesis [Desulfosporosinus youngiae DSM 17734]
MTYKLFCIPYAGGSASVYYSWKRYLPPGLELFPIELAGRRNRLKEPFYESIAAAVEDVFTIIRNQVSDNGAYAIFGHSMGSWITFEVAKTIFQCKKTPNPCHLFFSGNYPPHFSKGGGTIHQLPEKEFQQAVMQVGGTPKIIFENEDLCRLFSPIIRADYKLLEGYNGAEDSSFRCDCDITVLCGKKDSIKEGEALEWRRYAGRGFALNFFDGGHFFINEAAEAVVHSLSKTLNPHPAVQAG